MNNRIVKGLILFLIMVFAPFFLSIYYVNILTEIFILGILAISLNILVGQTGLVSLGHAAFFGVGGYTGGLIASKVSANGISNDYLRYAISFFNRANRIVYIY